MQTLRQASVDHLTQGLGILPAEIRSLGPVQAFLLGVSCHGSEPSFVAVTNAYCPRVGEEACTHAAPLLRGHFPGASVVFVLQDAPGAASVFMADRPEALTADQAFSIAAAVAVDKAVTGWDEADPIRVSIGGEVYAVTVRYDGSHWQAHA